MTKTNFDVYYDDPRIYFQIKNDVIVSCSLKHSANHTHMAFIVDFSPIDNYVTTDEVVGALKSLSKLIKNDLKVKRLSNLIKRIEKEGILP